MLVKMYVNDRLIETVEVSGPAYSPQSLLEELTKHHVIQFSDVIRFVPVHDTIQ